MKKLDALYDFIGEQADRVHETYPFWPCEKGCTALDGINCCHHALFPVTRTEWARVKGALHRLPQDKRAAVRSAAQATYDKYEMAQYAGSFSKLFQEHYGDIAPCPFLADNVCQVYHDRPVICRSYGYFTSSDEPHWCRAVTKTVVEHEVKRVPSWNALVERLTGSVKGPSKPLCAWVVEDV